MAKVFKPLTKAEEEIMQVLWKLEHAFIKDIVDNLPEPKPHYNTASTIVKILEEKGFVTHESFGKSNRYSAVIGKEEYSRKTMKQYLNRYFEGSVTNMFSFFVKEQDVSINELEELLQQLKKDQKKKK